MKQTSDGDGANNLDIVMVERKGEGETGWPCSDDNDICLFHVVTSRRGRREASWVPSQISILPNSRSVVV